MAYIVLACSLWPSLCILVLVSRWSRTYFSRSFKISISGKVPPWDGSRNLSPPIPHRVMEVDQIAFLNITPFIALDGVIQVVVISFSALLPISTGDIVLTGHDAGNLRPFRDLHLFVELLQHSVLLTKGKSTSWVQALRSPILLYISIAATHTARFNYTEISRLKTSRQRTKSFEFLEVNFGIDVNYERISLGIKR